MKQKCLLSRSTLCYYVRLLISSFSICRCDKALSFVCSNDARYFLAQFHHDRYSRLAVCKDKAIKPKRLKKPCLRLLKFMLFNNKVIVK